MADKLTMAQYLERFKKAKDEMPQCLKNSMVKIGSKWQGYTKDNTPVDTGTLRREWRISEPDIQGNTASITLSNSVDYASHVEYGHMNKSRTNWVEGNFMMTKSKEKVRQEMPKMLENELKRHLKKYGIGG